MISEQKTGISTVGLVVFFLNEKEFSIEIENLLAILNPAQNKLIRAKKIHKVNYHDILFPLFTAGGELLDDIDFAEKARILLLDYEGFSFGICVDKVAEVIRMENRINPVIDASKVKGSSPRLANGIILYENRRIFKYDLEKVVQAIATNIQKFKGESYD